jgi:hypothetical protein
MCFEFDFVMVGWDTTVGAASRLWAEWWRNWGLTHNDGKRLLFLFSLASGPALGPNQSVVEWVQGAVSPGVRLQLTTSMLRLRMVELWCYN